jgi:hypothetical protein
VYIRGGGGAFILESKITIWAYTHGELDFGINKPRIPFSYEIFFGYIGLYAFEEVTMDYDDFVEVLRKSGKQYDNYEDGDRIKVDILNFDGIEYRFAVRFYFDKETKKLVDVM